jgi:hypothetical protein
VSQLPPHNHYEFAQSMFCDCCLCSKWRAWVAVLRKVEIAAKGHGPICKCNICRILLNTRKSTLASELKLNLWIELGWYATIEEWDPGWEKDAWNELQQTDKWWIISGQYKPISFWLEKFEKYKAKEKLIYNYTK